MHAPLQNSRRHHAAATKGKLLVAAVSARALAQAARRGGWRVLAADFFGDDDTREAADGWAQLPGNLGDGVDAARVIAVLRDLAAEHGGTVDSLVLGSGFERLPELIDRLGEAFPLAGCRGAAVARVKDPTWLQEACAELGIPHPATRVEPPADPAGWLSKTAGGAGGLHVAPAPGRMAAPGRYFQQRIAGDSVSALFVAGPHGARVIGFSKQWTSPTAASPFRYGGAVRLPGFPQALAATVQTWLDELTRKAQLNGLCSADFIRSGTRLTLLEVNPRPGATLDIFDVDAAGLIDAHIGAPGDDPPPVYTGSTASVIAYASWPIPAFPTIDWPKWTADRQSAGTPLGAGDPVCTVFGQGATAAAARRQARDRLRRIEGEWRSS